LLKPAKTCMRSGSRFAVRRRRREKNRRHQRRRTVSTPLSPARPSCRCTTAGFGSTTVSMQRPGPHKTTESGKANRPSWQTEAGGPCAALWRAETASSPRGFLAAMFQPGRSGRCYQPIQTDHGKLTSGSPGRMPRKRGAIANVTKTHDTRRLREHECRLQLTA
jgi:hypothetical protein